MKNSGVVVSTGKNFVFLWMMIVLLGLQGCRKDDPAPDPGTDLDDLTIYEYIQTLYYHVYYWNKEVESNVMKRPPTSGDPEAYFERLKYDKDKASVSDRNSGRYDRWGFMTTFLDYSGVLVEGKYKSFGYNIAKASDKSYRICFVYKNSPMDRAGIKRGFELRKVGGKEIATLDETGKINEELNKETNQFVFVDHDGNVLEKTISAAEINIDPILYKAIYDVGGKKVGYIMYNTFIVASKAGITAALQEMKDVDEFVLDLRYNGGGSTNVAEAICEYLLPPAYGKDSVVFAKYVYSDMTKKLLKWKDEIVKIKRRTLAMDLSRMFVITTKGTASASEEVINDMSPFLDVITVGTTTHGKPVGMGVWFYPPYTDKDITAGKIPDWALAPITFRNDNKDDKGSFFSGISPTYSFIDDLHHDFGIDPQTLEGEGCLQAVMKFIQTGTFPVSVSAKFAEEETGDPFQLKGLQIHAGCR